MGGKQTLARGHELRFKVKIIGVEIAHGSERLAVAYIPIRAVQDLAFKRPNVGKAMWYETLVEASILFGLSLLRHQQRIVVRH